jgi:hypothetical protein
VCPSVEYILTKLAVEVAFAFIIPDDPENSISSKPGLFISSIS